jgi:hypothetical protein
VSDTGKINERDIEAAVCQYAKSKGAQPYKFTSPNRRSVPDRIFLAKGGHTAFIEFKSSTGNLTAGQERECMRLIALGFPVAVINDITIGKHFIDQWLETIS